MKAWKVFYPANGIDERIELFVYADTRGQAKAYALRAEGFEDIPYTCLRVQRVKEADKYYKPGKKELDWFDPEDRIALVKDFGYTCHSEFRCRELCAECSATEYCECYIKEEE